MAAAVRAAKDEVDRLQAEQDEEAPFVREKEILIGTSRKDDL